MNLYEKGNIYIYLYVVQMDRQYVCVFLYIFVFLRTSKLPEIKQSPDIALGCQECS